ncbi:hypothetical protein N7517_008519 [Penicillium concentricum]|uniref:Uncharacterized protein n=1 Tax=Penicillium concentricum TaxID=293559 RepID=A0A9W9V1R9_9EURO|nr:uncharacterized protein N7517_008519 [Penicillium concentricum]KAJ5365633.1 hypothetical protein N7517_008519 [Penicillium concentricum]
MDRVLATRSGSHVSSAGIQKQDLRSRRAAVGPDSPKLGCKGSFGITFQMTSTWMNNTRTSHSGLFAKSQNANPRASRARI